MPTCRIVPLGGLGEVGKNMTAFECDGAVLVIDAGLAFPRDEHLGVDLVLPDFAWLAERRDRIRAVVLTHGHEDHVGALPYLMREVGAPEVWATRLTLGMIKSKLDEHGLLRAAELNEIDPEGPPLDLGPFRLEFVRMAHSIPDSVAVVLETPAGRIVVTGDYKIDHTPVDGIRTDVGRLAEIGNRGVDLLLGDSTNAERAGVTQSERIVGEAFRQIIPLRTGRVIVSSFASNVHRMQQAIDVALDVGRKVSVVGRSMRKNINIARNLGYMDVPEGVLIKPAELDDYRPGEVLILCTGSQGEPLSALTRIAYNDHPAVHVERGDTVIISAKPIPGNELRVHDAINRLTKSGAEVLHEDNAKVHVSGHGNVEELRTILALLRPRAVMPVHGEFRMLAAHGRLAADAGVPAGSIVLAENGTVVELEPGRPPRIVDQFDQGVTFVDGLGVGDVEDVALRDRRRLSEDGVLIIVATLFTSNGKVSAQPELISRGFAEPGPLIDELRDEAERILVDCLASDVREIKLLQEHLHDGVGQLVYDRTRRRPMILPVVIEV
jgi:ribonuclease J